MRLQNPFFLERRTRAARANERGRDLYEQGRKTEAIAEYGRACRLDPDWSVPFYNLGLLYKYSGQWELSLQQSQRAVELDPGDDAAWWNLGIAATALERWDIARLAWRSAGMTVPDGDGPIDYPCGQAPIRLNPDTDGEVVWAERLDPARAMIQSIPLPESGFRFGDIVLNDGAANGYRKLGDSDVPVFDCLDILSTSACATCVAEIDFSSARQDAAPSPIELLTALGAERDLTVEDWTTSINMLCKACSEGRAHYEHELESAEIGDTHLVAIAAPDPELARALLHDWLPQSGGAVIVSFDVVLEGSND